MSQVERVQLSIQSLVDLDSGIVAEQVERHLRRVAQDCMDRPGDKSPRKTTLEFSFSPVCDQQGNAETVNCEVEIKSKVPVHRSKTYEMGLTKAGFIFNRDVPESLDQGVLFPKRNEKDEDE